MKQQSSHLDKAPCSHGSYVIVDDKLPVRRVLKTQSQQLVFVNRLCICMRRHPRLPHLQLAWMSLGICDNPTKYEDNAL